MADNQASESNIYTILIFIALLVLLAGVGYVWYRFYELTGSFVPSFGAA